jgi:hypothetical protein
MSATALQVIGMSSRVKRDPMFSILWSFWKACQVWINPFVERMK